MAQNIKHCVDITCDTQSEYDEVLSHFNAIGVNEVNFAEFGLDLYEKDEANLRVHYETITPWEA